MRKKLFFAHPIYHAPLLYDIPDVSAPKRDTDIVYYQKSINPVLSAACFAASRYSKPAEV